MKIIVVGGHGFVGKSLTKKLLDYPYEIFPLSREDGLDLTDLDSTKKYFSDIKEMITFPTKKNKVKNLPERL